MKKILYTVTILQTANAFLVPHLQMLKNEGYQIDIAGNSLEKSISDDLIDIVDNIFDIKFSRNPFSKANFKAFFEMRRILRENEYEIIHVHTPIASFITRIASILTNSKIYYTAHGFHFFRGAPLKNWLIYFTCEYLLSFLTDKTITMNNEDYQIAKKFFSNKRNNIYFCNGVGIDLNKFSPVTESDKAMLRKELCTKNNLKINLNDIVITYVAAISKRKNQNYIIESFKNGIPNDVKIILVGDGEDFSRISDLIEKYQLKENIFLVGRQNNINQWFAISDFAFSVSKQEGLPVNIMEAMATGLPILASNVRGNNDLVKNGNNGFLFDLDIRSNQNFKNILSRALTIKDLSSYSSMSLELSKKYNINNALEELKNIYFEEGEITS